MITNVVYIDMSRIISNKVNVIFRKVPVIFWYRMIRTKFTREINNWHFVTFKMFLEKIRMSHR